jgi:thioredoxin-like negative regulator of GroEL
MHRKRIPTWVALLIIGVALARPTAAGAQEVQWRSDYNAARKEAKQKGLPLVLDFYTTHCPWCDKLDETTYRDPVIAKAMNEQFVPVKLNGERETQLVQYLRISAFPTIVLSDPDGKILGSIEGYKEAAPFQEYLQRALAQVANPEWMLREYAEAIKSYNAPDYPRAVTLLKGILADGKSRPVQEKSRQLLAEIEKQGAGKLARAKQLLDRGQTAEASTALTEVVRLYVGTPGADEAGQMLTQMVKSPEQQQQQRTQRARELLAQAKEDFRTKLYRFCLDRCEILANGYGDLPEGAEAVQLAAEINGNTDLLENVKDSYIEKLSGTYLTLAEAWLRKGQPKQAVIYLERLIRTFPGSRQAEVAQIRLSQIQGQPTRTVDYQKQQ